MRALLWSSHLPKAPTPATITLELGFQYKFWEDINILSLSWILMKNKDLLLSTQFKKSNITNFGVLLSHWILLIC
jgi:hypothetical protein